MYMLQVANAINDAMNRIVGIIASSIPSALPIMSTRLVNCMLINVLAFIMSVFECPINKFVVLLCL